MAKAQLTAKETKSLKSLASEYEKMQVNQTVDKQASREKYWSELTVEEKIERMRINVKNTQSLVNSINNLREEVDMLFEHTHEEDGKLVIKVTKEQRHRLRSNIGGLAQTALTPRGISESETYF